MHWNSWRWASPSEQGRREERRLRWGPAGTARRSQRVLGEERCRWQPALSAAWKSREIGEIPAWVVSTLWLSPVTRWQQSTEVRPWLSGSRHCQAAKQGHGAWPPPLTLPELAAGPRRSSSSECPATEHVVCSPENWEAETFFSECQRHAANLSDRDDDTEVRWLRSSSCHYWEENTATNSPASLS